MSKTNQYLVKWTDWSMMPPSTQHHRLTLPASGEDAGAPSGGDVGRAVDRGQPGCSVSAPPDPCHRRETTARSAPPVDGRSHLGRETIAKGNQAVTLLSRQARSEPHDLPVLGTLGRDENDTGLRQIPTAIEEQVVR